MAVTWELETKFTDRVNKRIRVTGTPSDGRGPFSCNSQIDAAAVATSQSNVIKKLWEMYEEALAKEQDDATALDSFNAAVKTGLDGKGA